MNQTKFSKDDKVFAKVRGYPAWPARIVKAPDVAPNKMKYHVYFYGTAQSGVVKAKDICSYASNKSKLIKRKNYKKLSEASIELEEDMTPEELAKLDAAQESVKDVDNIQDEKAKNEDDKESGKIGDKRRQLGGLKIQKGKTAHPKSTPHFRKSTPSPSQPNVTLMKKTPQNTADKKRKSDDEPENSAKKSKRTTSTIVDEVSTSTILPDPISLSAAIVEEEGILSEEDDTHPKEIPEKPKAKILKSKPFEKQEKTVKKPKTLQEMMAILGLKFKPKRLDDGKTCTKTKDKSEDYLYVNKNTIYEFKIPLQINKPSFINSKLATEWDKLVLERANSLKTMIEVGDFTGCVHEYMDDYTQLLAAEFEQKKAEERHRKIFYTGRVLDTQLSIKTSLRFDSPDLIKCIKHLDEMDTLPISALLLKKFPGIVDTIDKVRKYNVFIDEWLLTPEEAQDFRKNVLIVRSKANHLYSKFKSLFFVPEGQSFYTHFLKEVDAFQINAHYKCKKFDDIFQYIEFL